MYAQENDHRWRNKFLAVALLMAAITITLACTLAYVIWRPFAPTKVPTAGPTTAPAASLTTAPARAIQPAIPQGNKTAKDGEVPDEPKQPAPVAPTMAVMDYIVVDPSAAKPTMGVMDYVVVDTPVPAMIIGALGADLEAYMIRPFGDQLWVYVRNNGPATLVGQRIDAECEGPQIPQGTQLSAGAPLVRGTGGAFIADTPAGGLFAITVPLVLDRGYSYPAIRCSLILSGNFDTNPDNNASTISISVN